MQRVLLGMSGGVDSTVSALLLKKMGYEVVGLTIRMWDGYKKEVNIPQYVQAAKDAAKKINIEHYTEDAQEEFYRNIVVYFKQEYLKGKTPNPCTKCNTDIKWRILNQAAIKLNCELLATGHFVRKEQDNNFFYVKKGIDSEKEQSFFLWGLSQEILKKALFPLGELTKQQVREIAEDNDFVSVNKKKESTGLCFLSSNYQSFLKDLLAKDNIVIEQGNFVDNDGNVLGKHNGYPFYTVGQRRGLGIVSQTPNYVKQILPQENKIVLSNKKALYKNSMLVENYNLINSCDFSTNVISKIRYRKQAAQSYVEIINEEYLKVNFLSPEWSIAPGQTVAFYNKERLLGGGFIVG